MPWSYLCVELVLRLTSGGGYCNGCGGFNGCGVCSGCDDSLSEESLNSLIYALRQKGKSKGKGGKGGGCWECGDPNHRRSEM